MRDPHQVRVTRLDGEGILPTSADPAVVPVEGAYLNSFTSTPYRVLLQRDAAGELTLRCEGCDGRSLTLLNAAGVMTPVTYGDVIPEPSRLSLDAQGVAFEAPSCVFARGRRCTVRAATILATPWSNVADVHRVRFTLPPLGAGLLGMSLIPLGVCVASAAVRHGDPRVQVPVSAAFLAGGVAVMITGIWHLTAPPVEEHADASHPLAP